MTDLCHPIGEAHRRAAAPAMPAFESTRSLSLLLKLPHSCVTIPGMIQEFSYVRRMKRFQSTSKLAFVSKCANIGSEMCQLNKLNLMFILNLTGECQRKVECTALSRGGPVCPEAGRRAAIAHARKRRARLAAESAVPSGYEPCTLSAAIAHAPAEQQSWSPDFFVLNVSPPDFICRNL